MPAGWVVLPALSDNSLLLMTSESWQETDTKQINLSSPLAALGSAHQIDHTAPSLIPTNHFPCSLSLHPVIPPSTYPPSNARNNPTDVLQPQAVRHVNISTSNMNSFRCYINTVAFSFRGNFFLHGSEQRHTHSSFLNTVICTEALS